MNFRKQFLDYINEIGVKVKFASFSFFGPYQVIRTEPVRNSSLWENYTDNDFDNFLKEADFDYDENSLGSLRDRGFRCVGHIMFENGVAAEIKFINVDGKLKLAWESEDKPVVKNSPNLR